MNARDLPGIGDTANPFGYAPPNSPDFRDNEAQDTRAANIEAFSEWADSFKAAAQRGDKRRMEQARLFVVSLMNDIGDMQCFGAIAQRRITILPTPLQLHIKTANQARAVIGRVEYALQHDRREDAHALAIRARQLIGEIIDATK